ncbi:MAG: hypothetical protein H0X33_00700 [Taibaiella sp.]|nr:hypothetical protein [Taibaiella sp.]
MKNKLLLPHKYRMIGCILVLPAAALMIAVYVYNFSFRFLRSHLVWNEGAISDKIDFTGTISIIISFISLFMIAFSKERIEDEYVAQVRLRALQISVYVSYLVLALGTLIFYDFSYLWVLYINMFTIPVIFIVLYQYHLHIKPRISNQSPV